MTAKLKTVPSTKKPKAEAKPKQELHPEVLQEAEKQVAAEVALPELTVYPGPEVKSAFEFRPDGEVDSYPLSPEETIGKAQGALDPDVPLRGAYDFKPQARWDGKVLEPVKRLKVNEINRNNPNFYLIDNTILYSVVESKDALFTEYLVEGHGYSLRLIMDDKSTFEGFSSQYYRAKGEGFAVLVNSSSHIDSFINGTLLAGVDSEHGVYNSSTLSSYPTSEKAAKKKTSWDIDGVDFGIPGVAKEHKRLRVEGLWLKHSHVLDTEINTGMISNSRISESRLKASNVTVKHSQLDGVMVTDASQIYLRHCRLERVSFNSVAGTIDVRNANLNNKYFVGGGPIFIDTRFAVMNIPVFDGREIYLIRQSTDKFSVVTGWGQSETIDKNISTFDLEKLAIKVLNYGDVSVYELDGIARSFVSFVVDSITSRLKIIAVIDRAHDVSSCLQARESDYVDFFGD